MICRTMFNRALVEINSLVFLTKQSLTQKREAEKKVVKAKKEGKVEEGLARL